MGNTGKEKPQDGLPNSVLNDIGEHSIGGFAVFYFNNETGQPEHAMSFDSTTHCLALQKYMSDWLGALNEATKELSKNRIIHRITHPEQDDDEEQDGNE